jgi:hypothetical protein
LSDGWAKSHLTPQSLSVFLFTFLSLTSVAYVFASTANYLQFYPAIGRINFRILNVVVQRDSASNQTHLIANFAVDNPTGYSGFRVKSFDLSIYFIHQTPQNNSTLFRFPMLVGSTPVDSPLGPNAKISSNVTIVFYPDQSSQFRNFNETFSGQITARAFETVQLITFLDPVIGRMRLNSQEDLQLR